MSIIVSVMGLSGYPASFNIHSLLYSGKKMFSPSHNLYSNRERNILKQLFEKVWDTWEVLLIVLVGDTNNMLIWVK